jgi:hypothetical protein
MGMEYEHWDNGKVYLHRDRWEAFRANIEKHGAYNPGFDEPYLHYWNNERIFLCLHTPRASIFDLPAIGEPDLKYKIESHSEYKVIYQPYPAFMRTEDDPESWLPSWNLWAESNQKNGEDLGILYTGEIFRKEKALFTAYGLGSQTTRKNQFAVFRNQFWLIKDYYDYGYGSHPMPKPRKKKVLSPRSIYDSFEEGW